MVQNNHQSHSRSVSGRNSICKMNSYNMIAAGFHRLRRFEDFVEIQKFRSAQAQFIQPCSRILSLFFSSHLNTRKKEEKN